MTREQQIHLLETWGVSTNDEMTDEDLSALVERGDPQEESSGMVIDEETKAYLDEIESQNSKAINERASAIKGRHQQALRHMKEIEAALTKAVASKDCYELNLATNAMRSAADEAIYEASMISIHLE